MNRLHTLLTATAVALCSAAHAQQSPPVLHVYGPGGPAPAMKEAARQFSERSHIPVDVVAGPTPQWADQAKQDADPIFSGAENMMGDFAKALPDGFDLASAEPLYLRPVAILVRPGNPKRIHGFRNLLEPGMKVLTVAGAGQTGLWEDVAGRTGNIGLVRAFRHHVVFPEAGNSALARQAWTEHPEIDAWLIWNIWQVANPDLADVVPVEPAFRIYRDSGVVITHRSAAVPQVQAFVDYLKSEAGRRIFAKWGWSRAAR